MDVENMKRILDEAFERERRKNLKEEQKMEIKLTREQIEYILNYDKTRSVATACNLAQTLVNQVLEKLAEELS